MTPEMAIAGFSALAQPMRLAALRELVAAHPHGLVAGELAARLDALPNSLSANLSVLAQAGLVTTERQGRSIRYHARPDHIAALAAFLLRDCCGGRPGLCGPSLDRLITQSEAAMTERPFNVLFLCTANSARSLIGEAILNADPSGRFRGFSAGSQPAAAPNPCTIQLLERLGYPTAGLRSKSWDEFAAPDAPQMDFVFTVCDSAANETCPIWPGHPISAHWSIPDPGAATGTEAEIAHAFNRAHRLLATRIGLLAALPVETLGRNSLQSEVENIGNTPE